MRALALLLPLLLSYCEKDETISGFVVPDATWYLTELNGEVVSAMANMTFPEQGIITGNGPCNAFNTTQNAPYPWFEVTAILATKTACHDLALEYAFFTALEGATFVEVSGNTLILSNDTGITLAFENR